MAIYLIPSPFVECWLSCLPCAQVPDSDTSSCEEDAFVSALNDWQKQLHVQCSVIGSSDLSRVAQFIHQLLDAFPMESTGT